MSILRTTMNEHGIILRPTANDNQLTDAQREALAKVVNRIDKGLDKIVMNLQVIKDIGAAYGSKELVLLAESALDAIGEI